MTFEKSHKAGDLYGGIVTSNTLFCKKGDAEKCISALQNADPLLGNTSIIVGVNKRRVRGHSSSGKLTSEIENAGGTPHVSNVADGKSLKSMTVAEIPISENISHVRGNIYVPHTGFNTFLLVATNYEPVRLSVLEASSPKQKRVGTLFKQNNDSVVVDVCSKDIGKVVSALANVATLYNLEQSVIVGVKSRRGEARVMPDITAQQLLLEGSRIGASLSTESIATTGRTDIVKMTARPGTIHWIDRELYVISDSHLKRLLVARKGQSENVVRLIKKVARLDDNPTYEVFSPSPIEERSPKAGNTPKIAFEPKVSSEPLKASAQVRAGTMYPKKQGRLGAPDPVYRELMPSRIKMEPPALKPERKLSATSPPAVKPLRKTVSYSRARREYFEQMADEMALMTPKEVKKRNEPIYELADYPNTMLLDDEQY